VEDSPVGAERPNRGHRFDPLLGEQMSKESPLIPADAPGLDADKFFLDFYLEFVNNFLTIAGIARHYKINQRLAHELMCKGRAINVRNQLEGGDPPEKKGRKMRVYPMSDLRWTITREFTGKDKPQFVVRFCDEWIDSRGTYPAAVVVAVAGKARRDEALSM